MKIPLEASLSRTAVFLVSLLSAVIAGQSAAHADGGIIDKIYHPYVQPQERELELRSSLEQGSKSPDGNRQLWHLGYGMSLRDNIFGELYLIGEKNSEDSLRVSEYEAELLWQITEQGEYAADWGLLFEFATSDDLDEQEIATTLLAETEWRQWSGTVNLTAAYEFGDDISNEFETAAALQLRYRLSMALEPALEIYSGEDILGAGPVLLGNYRLGPGKQLHWEGGLIFGLDDSTADRTFRLLLEYEF